MARSKIKNILLVGGAGYVGGAVTDELLKYKEYNLRIYDSLLYEEFYLKDIEFYHGDIRDRKKLIKHLNWSDAVIWMSALVGDGACDINPKETIELNENSVRWLSKKYNKKIIFFSTCSVYGAQEGVLSENSKLNPLSLYAKTKLNAENFLKDKNCSIFRLGTLFGIGDTYSRIRMDLVLNALTIKAFFEKRLDVFGGEQFRPLLHVKDVARAVLLALKENDFSIYNLSHKNIKIKDLANKIKENTGKNVKIITTQVMFQDTRNYRVSNILSKKKLGFKTIYNIEYGIREIVNLAKSGRIRDFGNIRYTNVLYLKK